jgi:hypothetical protein
MSILTGRYSGSAESSIDFDIRQIDQRGIDVYGDNVIRGELSDAFWETTLPQSLTTSVASSPFFHAYTAAQVRLNDKGFLSRDITVRELIEYRSDVHHIFPRDLLKKAGMTRGWYNQIANYAITQSEINIAIGNKPPATYFQQMFDQVNGGERRFGNITDPNELRENLAIHCIPQGIENATVDDYKDFLDARRQLMAQRIKVYFEGL